MDLNQRLLNAFQIEHVEHLEGIRSALVRLGEMSGEPDGSALEEAFRCAHSLKGAARIIGLAVVETLAHHLESLFARLRGLDHALEADCLSVVHLTLDTIEDAAGAFLRKELVELPERVLQELNRLLIGEPATAGTGYSCKPIAAAPAPEPAAACEEPSPRVALRPVDSVRLSAESLDRLLQSSAQLLTASQQHEMMLRELHGLTKEITALNRQWEAVMRSTADRRGHGEAAGLAHFRNRIELIDHQFHSVSRHARSVVQLQQHNAWSHRQLADQLREDVRRARMVPAENLFQGFRKMMRDLARDEGKQIDFRVSGMDTEADRAVLQALKDPLMHLLRNAVSHGIESPERRVAAGKQPQGRVSLEINAVGNQLIVAVEDDGQGIDVGRVSEAAARQGLIAQADDGALSDAELLKILTRPGFSTCDNVTELAGRGLGLSIVDETIARLQGHISVGARAEGGTIVSLTIPTTVSTHRILLITCLGQTFGIPLAAIETLLSVDRRTVDDLEGRPVIALDGRLTPVANLARLLKLTDAAAASQTDKLMLVVLKSAGRRLAVAVDALLVERDAVIQRLSPPASKSAYCSGGILQEDGSVSLVLDPTILIERSTEPDVAMSRASPASADKRRPTILVVDDSVTTRTLETTILQSHGYQVRVAVDGLEALTRLRAEHIDLVVSDIQMPRLDGFGLLEEIKSDSQLSATPVIIVSSMENRQYQERGLQLGADAYIVKRNFDHQDLLQTIEQIV